MAEVFTLGAVLAGGVGVMGLAVALFGGAEPHCLCAFDGDTEACDTPQL
ncbi:MULTISPECIES: hypothetical protein [Rhodococcus]|nr:MULTISPECIES: hypothetical protein [Rhodococcus]WAM15685.1 hypothetical protein OYT95_03255 [Rhodococcus sp. JS3073]